MTAHYIHVAVYRQSAIVLPLGLKLLICSRCQSAGSGINLFGSSYAVCRSDAPRTVTASCLNAVYNVQRSPLRPVTAQALLLILPDATAGSRNRITSKRYN